MDFLPAWIRPVVTAMPLTYLADALRQIMVGATPVYSLGLDFAVLTVWLIVGAALAVRFFRLHGLDKTPRPHIMADRSPR